MFAHAVSAKPGAGKNSRDRTDRAEATARVEDQVGKGPVNAIGPVHVNVKKKLDVLFLCFEHRPTDGNTGIIDDAPQAAALFAHELDGRVYLFLNSDVKANSHDVVHCTEALDVRGLARPRINKVPLCSKPLCDPQADARAGTSDQHGFLSVFVRKRCR